MKAWIIDDGDTKTVINLEYVSDVHFVLKGKCDDDDDKDDEGKPKIEVETEKVKYVFWGKTARRAMEDLMIILRKEEEAKVS